MPLITLLDGSQKNFEKPVTVGEVAKEIGPGLAKAALAGKVNGTQVDLSYLIDADCEVAIITNKDEAGLEIMRHSCAHLLAHAVQSIYPDVQVTIGPVIEDGFYYDFASPKPFTPEDLEKFELKMYELAQAGLEVEQKIMTRDEAIYMFNEMGEHYKVKIIEAIPSDEPLTFYKQGDFIDLCRGPHVANTAQLSHFKLMKLAGAYWRGDANNEMLQRVYGTLWSNKKDLKAYLHRIEEAEKRDHRKLGKKYQLFHMQEEAPGMVFWHPKGWTVYQLLEQFIRNTINKRGYQEIRTPQILDRSLWERSGHWDMFEEEMFSVQSEDKHFAVKPMNCPCHVQIYNQGTKSYKDLPIRLAEFGCCHRNELSGALHGLMRARAFTQDDAHIFCTENQIQQEVSNFIKLLFEVYEVFGFKEVSVKLSTRPEKRVGTDEVWDKAEAALKIALDENAIDWVLSPGEGAFYGPKLEFTLKDCIGRLWQCGTVQVDFSMPERLGAVYVAEDNTKRVPVMIHRAILGSLERFVGILTEEFAGSFPTWLAPIQVVIMNISENQQVYVEKCTQNLKNQGFRVVSDLRNEKIGFKIREHTVQRVPYLVVIGDNEVESQTLSIRTRDGKDLGVMHLDKFTDILKGDMLSH